MKLTYPRALDVSGMSRLTSCDCRLHELLLLLLQGLLSEFPAMATSSIRAHIWRCTLLLLLLFHSWVVAAVPVTHPLAQTYVNRKLRASTPSCTKADISITQGKSGNSNGIPAFSVQITNLCVNHNCQLKNIHVACAAFASARPLDSRVFQRIQYNDCLVMDGAPLRAGGSVVFEYANSSEYPMHVISADLGPCS